MTKQRWDERENKFNLFLDNLLCGGRDAVQDNGKRLLKKLSLHWFIDEGKACIPVLSGRCDDQAKILGFTSKPVNYSREEC